MASFTSSMRSFWHSVTTNDRHASYDSPYRSGGHVPLSQSKHAPLTSIATNAMESRTDLNDSEGFMSNDPLSPSSPYAPGMRTLSRQSSSQDTAYAANGMGSDVQMQSFSEGLPPPPPVAHSWKRIDRWMEDNYEELWENLGEGCTQNDVNELEHELDCTLPQEVRESLQAHDGQERGGRPTGAIFGCMLLDCEEIVQEWNQWRRTNDEYLREPRTYAAPQAPSKAFAGSSAASSSAAANQAQQVANPHWRQELLARQDSQPSNAIQKAYIHPAWIPLARDWGGNNIAVDLAPGPTGQWGQVILMGRDYDCKYVVARSWAAFLANVADDMSTDKWYIEEDTAELKLREFPSQPTVQPAYMDILRWRADQKYGRKQPPAGKGRRPVPQNLKINSNVKNDYASLNGFSPYASPTTPGDDRGRSPPRAHGKGVAMAVNIGSPLARVTEEQTNSSEAHDRSSASAARRPIDRLVRLDSPITGRNSVESTNLLGEEKRSSDVDRVKASGLGSAEISADDPAIAPAANAIAGAEDGEMSAVQL